MAYTTLCLWNFRKQSVYYIIEDKYLFLKKSYTFRLYATIIGSSTHYFKCFETMWFIAFYLILKYRADGPEMVVYGRNM